MKIILPYIILIIAFIILFVLTQIIDTKILFLGFNSDSGDVIYNHKTSLQKFIFVYGLALSVSILNVLFLLKTNHSKIGKRILIGSISILIIYLINFYSSKIFYSEGFNIYYDWRINLGVDLSILTVLISVGLSLILNWITLNRKKNK